MLIGYCRVSTVEQDAGFEAQERDLKAAGVERLFSERTSAVGPRRAGWRVASPTWFASSKG